MHVESKLALTHLDKGATFIHGDRVYIKSDPVIGSQLYNCVAITTGNLRQFEYCIPVTPVSLKVVPAL